MWKKITAILAFLVGATALASGGHVANSFFVMPSSGNIPGWRLLQASDIPTALGTTTLSALTTQGLVLNSSAGALSSLAPGTSGNVAVSNGTQWTAGTVGTAGIATGAITIAKMAGKTASTTATAGNIALSNSTSTFSTTSATLVDVTNATVTLTSTGRPIFVGLIPDGNITTVSLVGATSGNWNIVLYNGVGASPASWTPIGIYGVNGEIPVTSIWTILNITPGATYSFKVMADISAGTALCQYARLIAFEL